MSLIALLVIAVVAVLLLLATLMPKRKFAGMSSDVASLDLDQAEHQHKQALTNAARRFEKNTELPIGREEYEYYMTLAVMTKDRIERLNGRPGGPAARKKWRKELALQIKRLAAENNAQQS